MYRLPWSFLAQEHWHGPAWQLPVALKSPPPVEGELDPPMRPPGAVISGIALIAFAASSTEQQYMYPASRFSIPQSTQLSYYNMSPVKSKVEFGPPHTKEQAGWGV